MNDKEKFSESLVTVLKKMCSIIEVEYHTIDFQKEDWYFDHEWTIDQEHYFIDWLIMEVRANNDLRKELSTLPYRPNMTISKNFAMWFNMMYGWKTRL